MVLSFQNITHEIGGNTLFQDVGFSLAEGCLLVIKGPNGCGKTTLLKIIAGLVVPKYGFIFHNEDEVSEDYRKYFSQLQFLGHKNALDMELTVMENLKFWAGIHGNPETINAAINFFKLDKYLNIQCRYLSAGWQKRVALSRLMLQKAKVWVLDEPFSNLDSEMIDMTLKLIATFCDQGGIIILSTHQEVSLPFGMPMQLTDFTPLPDLKIL